MSNIVKGFTVILENEVREDDVKIINQAISMIKGVAKVDNVLAHHEDHFVEQRIKHELKIKAYNAIKSIFQNE
jgi:hypothetical protein